MPIAGYGNCEPRSLGRLAVRVGPASGALRRMSLIRPNSDVVESNLSTESNAGDPASQHVVRFTGAGMIGMPLG